MAHTPEGMTIDTVVDLSARHCAWCGIDSDSTYVFDCPACGRLTCRSCVYLYDEATACKHTTPRQRHVLVRQDWNDG